MHIYKCIVSPSSPAHPHAQSLCHPSSRLQRKKMLPIGRSDSADPPPANNNSQHLSSLPVSNLHLNSGMLFFPVLGRGMNNKIQSVMTDPADGMPTVPPVGYRFRPTDEELVTNYLKPKLLGDGLEDLLIIAVVNVCKHEPWDLPVKSEIKSEDSVWYFFCPRDLKYSNSRRSNRRTKAGFWKPTGKTIQVKAKHNKKVIGTKKTLVFYKSASPKPERTGWIIHEYDEFISGSSLSNLGEYVLCKLKRKLDVKTSKGAPKNHMASISGFEAEPSCSMDSDFENQNHSELTVNSAFVESESNHHPTSDSENQNSDELMTNSTQEASDLSHFLATNIQNPNELISSSALDGWGSCPSISFDFENELISKLANDESGLIQPMTSNHESRYPNGLVVNSAHNGSEQSHCMASDSENQNPTDASPYENWLAASDLEDQLSPLQADGPSTEMPSHFRNCLLASDFENQNLDKETDISAPDEGERSSLAVRPLDSENQNPWEKTDISTLEEGGLCCLMASTEKSPAYYSFPEFPQLSPKLLAELEEFLELEGQP
ncbi:putative proteinC DOMAIN-CONTAINING PROTEIN 82-RELATED [Salix purpurea]|uniref:NAC domain-containing protein n=1 Tax=Salix purpurea TaxID=77065 RepID=A0A9Q0SQF8_SALPP|nr:putative proteinC DOMAIN-CONTAINING PROTEIN 82-RELATED [Salix purpurea]